MLLISALVASAFGAVSERDWLDGYLAGSRALERRDFAAARVELEAALALQPRHAGTAYQLACLNAAEGRRAAALEWLRVAIERGFADAAVARWDLDLASLREDEEFERALRGLELPASHDSQVPELVWNTATIANDVSSDGNFLVAGRGNRSALWDLRTRELVASLEMPGERGAWVAQSPDGRFTAWTGEGPGGKNHARLHDTATGDFLRELPDAAEWQARADFSVDGSRLSVHSTGPRARAVTFRTVDGSLISRPSGFDFEQAVPSPHHSCWLFVERRGQERSDLILWNVNRGAIVTRIDDAMGPPNLTVAFSAGDELVAVHAWAGKEVLVLDTTSGRVLHKLTSEVSLSQLAFVGPDGAQLAAARSDGSIVLWNLSDGKVARTLSTGFESLVGIEANARGDALLLNWFGPPPALFDLASGSVRWKSPELRSWAWNSSWAVSDERILVPQDRRIQLLDARDGRVVCEVSGPGRVVVTGGRPNGVSLWLGSENGVLREVSRATGRVLRTTAPMGSAIVRITERPDGKQLATLSTDGMLRIFDTKELQETARCERLLADEWNHTSATLSFCGDGSMLLLVDPKGPLTVIDAQSGARRASWERHPKRFPVIAAFARGDRLLCATGEEEVVERAASTGEVKRRIPVQGIVDVIALEPGETRAWIATRDSKVKVVDLATASAVRVLDHSDLDPFDSVEFGSISFSPDGKRAVVASSGFGVVACWDVATGERVWSYEYDGGNPASLFSRFSANGRRVFVWGQGRWSTRIVDADTGKTLVDLADREIWDVLAAGDGRSIAASSTRGLELLDDSTGASRVSRVEFDDDGWILRASASGHLDGTRKALAAAHLTLPDRTYPADGLAAAFVDVKKVAAAAAGIEVIPVAPVTIPTLNWTTTTPRVLRLAADRKEITLEAEATCTSGVTAYEVVVNGTRSHVAAEALDDAKKDRTKSRWSMRIARPAPNEAVEVRIRAVASDGLMSRPLRVAVEARP